MNTCPLSFCLSKMSPCSESLAAFLCRLDKRFCPCIKTVLGYISGCCGGLCWVTMILLTPVTILISEAWTLHPCSLSDFSLCTLQKLPNFFGIVVSTKDQQRWWQMKQRSSRHLICREAEVLQEGSILRRSWYHCVQSLMETGGT